jgi:lysophospholipase L1-like esterase
MLASPADALVDHGLPVRPANSGRLVRTGWVASWAASPQVATLASPQALHGFRNVTLRQIVFSTAAGSMVRVRFTNAYGGRPLRIGRAAIAVTRAGAAVVPRTVRQLAFLGRSSVVVPVGSEVLSDPVQVPVQASTRLAISIYLPGPTGSATLHAGAHETNYLEAGSHVLDPGFGPFGRLLGDWYFISEVDTYSPSRYLGALVAFGDSITSGVGSLTDADANWPDQLSRRLNAVRGSTLSVVDAGIGGNRVLSGSSCCGPSALDRFGPDVEQTTGARVVILLEGVNDIGYGQQRTADTLPHTDVTAAQIIAGDEQLIADAHALGLRIFGATILPFAGARYWTAAGELKREAVNRWILTSGAFDGVIDTAAAVADPADPERLNPAYDSGDHLHPNDAGYRAIANAIPLAPLLAAAR